MTCSQNAPDADRRVADDEGGRRGDEAAAQGIDVDRLRRRRAGLSDADAHRRRGARGHRRELHEVHADSGIAELKRAICARYKTDYGVEYATSEVDRHRRRQAGAVQHRAGALRPRRRGHHARAGLADARRADQAGRRDAGDRAHARRGRLRAARRDDPRGDHAADARHHHQLAVQSDRRADLRGRAGGASPTRPRGAASGSSSISATRS